MSPYPNCFERYRNTASAEHFQHKTPHDKPSMASTKVLIIGGHGKVALQLTPLLLGKSWTVTSLIRNPDHEAEIAALGKGKPGKVEFAFDSLDEVTSVSHAESVLKRVDPTIVVWSAGAGGKGGPERTKQVDEIAAKHYISAAIARPNVKKFLMVSYVSSRRAKPSWWDDEDWKAAEHVNQKVLPAYFQAKVEADEHLAALSKKRNETDPAFQGINLRPGTLKDKPCTGRVSLGKTKARGEVSRETVAKVASALLDRDDVRGWWDLLEGDEEIEVAVERLAKENWDGIEGEDLGRIYGRASL